MTDQLTDHFTLPDLLLGLLVAMIAAGCSDSVNFLTALHATFILDCGKQEQKGVHGSLEALGSTHKHGTAGR